MTVLSKSDWNFWQENGYVIIPNAVPQGQLDRTVEAIWWFLDMDPNDSNTWYRYKPYTREDRSSPISGAGMVEMYQHQALWDNRQCPRVYQAFSEIWDDEKLWVSLDRANMKPPARPDQPDWGHKGMIHWDLDTSRRPIEFGVQGVLFLTDTEENQGGFQCVPGFNNTFEEWVKTQPEDRNPNAPDLTDLEVKAIPGKAGDLLIWHRLLAHGNGHNLSDKPRLAQYITMSPAPEDADESRKARVSAWQERRAMHGWPGDSRDWEQSRLKTAELTTLGKKLLGVELWD